MKPGATGSFPRGKLRPDDEGELVLSTRVVNGTIIVDFGKPVSWIGMGPECARALARSIIESADEAEKSR